MAVAMLHSIFNIYPLPLLLPHECHDYMDRSRHLQSETLCTRAHCRRLIYHYECSCSLLFHCEVMIHNEGIRYMQVMIHNEGIRYMQVMIHNEGIRYMQVMIHNEGIRVFTAYALYKNYSSVG